LEAIGAAQPNQEFSNIAMQLSGIVNVDPNGLTGKEDGTLGSGSIPEGKGVSQSFFVAVL